MGQWSNAEAELAALQGEAVLRIANGIQQFEDKLQQCASWPSRWAADGVCRQPAHSCIGVQVSEQRSQGAEGPAHAPVEAVCPGEPSCACYCLQTPACTMHDTSGSALFSSSRLHLQPLHKLTSLATSLECHSCTAHALPAPQVDAILQETENAHFIFRNTLLSAIGLAPEATMSQLGPGTPMAELAADEGTIPAVYSQMDSLKASAEAGDPLAANILGERVLSCSVHVRAAQHCLANHCGMGHA